MSINSIKVKDQKNKMRVAWGITGGGHRLAEIVEKMKDVKILYQDSVDISVYLSKAGYVVAKYYGLIEYLKEKFGSFEVEKDANTPFLAGALQLKRFEFLLIAPATSNTVAKISIGIADSLLSNSAIMALKAFVPVYVVPTDYREGFTITRLPNGQELRLRIRREDAENIKKLDGMDGISVIEELEEIHQIFRKHFRL